MNGNAQNIEQLAADWITRQLSGQWTQADQALFDEWIAADTAHRIAYVRLDAAWQRLGRLKAVSGAVPSGIVPLGAELSERPFPYSGSSVPLVENARGPMAPPTARNRRIAQMAAIAASLVLVIGLGLYIFSSDLFARQRYVTPVGATNTVSLKDGSSITLNTDTRLHVAFAEAERRIELERGEAFFDVAKDSARPFVVAAGGKRVVAVGTRFSVRRANETIRVAVADGKVRIEPAGLHFSAEDNSGVILAAGSVAQTKKAGLIVREHASAEVEQWLSWRYGVITLHETPVGEAVAEFNRYNERKIVIRDAAIADIKVGGSFKSTNADAFLWMLQRGFAISVERTQDGVVLTRP